jgi:ADP-ribosyl-[dinitrogen reductase] hydrolase
MTSVTRTSRTHPLRIDEVPANDAGGLIGITFCPGKCGPSVAGHRWERDLAADLDVVSKWRPDAVVTLVERHELEMLGVPRLGEQIVARGIEWHHLPIVDVRPPDERFEAAWRSSGPVLNRRLREGGRVLVHCRGGLGRAGTIAARLLVELGVGADEAVRRVRAARPGAIETNEQLNHVLSLPRALH